MITNNISWSLGATPNKSLASSVPSIPIPLQSDLISNRLGKIHVQALTLLGSDGGLLPRPARKPARRQATRPTAAKWASESILRPWTHPSRSARALVPRYGIRILSFLCHLCLCHLSFSSLCLRLCALSLTLSLRPLTNFSFAVNKIRRTANNQNH